MEGFTNHLIALHYSPHREEMQMRFIWSYKSAYFTAMLHNHSVKKNP